MVPVSFETELDLNLIEVDDNNIPPVDAPVWSFANRRLERRGPLVLTSTIGLRFARGGPGGGDTCVPSSERPRLLRVLLLTPVETFEDGLGNTAGGVGVPGRKSGCFSGSIAGGLSAEVSTPLRARTPAHAAHSFLQLLSTCLWMSAKPASRSSWSYLAFSVSICVSLRYCYQH